MPNFLVRVEINPGSPSDYQRIHTLLVSLNYSDSYIMGPFKYKLPAGTYIHQGAGLDVGGIATSEDLSREAEEISNFIRALKVCTGAPLIAVSTFKVLGISGLPCEGGYPGELAQ